MSKNYKSQYNQDKYCFENFLNKLPTPGTFVEVGASDGIKLSNSYFYEKELGWSGLCIEPRKKAFSDLLLNRKCFCENVGISLDFCDNVEFQDIEGWGEGLSGIISKYDKRHTNIIDNHIKNHPENKGYELTTIKTVPLQYLLDKYCLSHINLLSVDTEGGELEILKSIDWFKTTIDVLIVENNYNDNNYFKSYLSLKGMVYAGKLEIDEIYVRNNFIDTEVIKVCFLSSWSTPKQLTEEYKSTLPNNKSWINVIPSDEEDCNLYVVMEGVKDTNIYNTEKRLICFPREPSVVNPIKQYINFGKKYSYDDIYHCVPQFNFLEKDINFLMEHKPEKTKNLSCIVSSKTHSYGSIKRLEIAKKFKEKYGNLLDLYGKGIKPIKSKLEGLINYNYSLCMENCQEHNYFTEKFTDAIVCWTIPIYWGCPNISDYFPDKSYYSIDIFNDNVFEEIKRISELPITNDNLIALHHARNLIFSRYNVWNTIREYQYPQEFTVVTGFFDIKRHEWGTIHQRTKEDYLVHISNMMRFPVNMVIYIEEENYDFIYEIRKNVDRKTTIIIKKIEELYMYQHLEKLKQITNDPNYYKDHPSPFAPEISQPLYNVVTCSKIDLLAEATKLLPNFDYYIWLDAGYTHNTIDLSKHNWRPTTFFKNRDKLSMVIVNDPIHAKSDPKEFFLQYIDITSGGFLGGYADKINKIRDLFYNLVNEMFELNIKDDDQFYYTILLKRHPELFKTFLTSWYGSLYIS